MRAEYPPTAITLLVLPEELLERLREATGREPTEIVSHMIQVVCENPDNKEIRRLFFDTLPKQR